MINLVLPPLYQQHYFAQPQPQLYQPIRLPASQTAFLPENTTQSSITPDSNPSSIDTMQNESPMAVLNANISALTEKSNDKPERTDSFATSTEKILEFRPVQKKPNNRIKPISK